MIIVGSSFSGAALVMDGALLILPFLAFLLDRSGAAPGRFLPIVVYIVLGAAMGWQFVNLRRWVGASQRRPANRLGRAASCASTAFATRTPCDGLQGLWRQQFILSVSQGLDREVCPMYIFYGII